MASTDGTALNPGANGDLISDEDMTGQPRQDSKLPQLGSANASYKNERTKIAIGPYGSDFGDAAPGTGLDVRTYQERVALEESMIRDTDCRMATLSSSDRGRRIQLVDARGGSYRGSTR
jgi:hypothetical protein